MVFSRVPRQTGLEPRLRVTDAKRFRGALHGRNDRCIFCERERKCVCVPQNMALYRKWRPLTFGQVAGQEHITAALRAQVESGRVSHAYLFTGTRGTGKTTCAKILARAVCCENPRGGEPCNECEACRSILADSAMDVTEIDAASNNGVDNIREIREEAVFSPGSLARRVYIVDEVHMLSPGAFNALLKILEEPPAHVLFILATTEIHKIPATILSRCQRYDFRRIPAEIIAERLGLIAESEGYTLRGDAAALLARMGDGSMRDAISLLDRSLPESGEVTAEIVEEALGAVPAERAAALLSAAAAGDVAEALRIFTESYLEGRDIVSLFDELLSMIRDIYIIKAAHGAEYLVSVQASDMTRLERLAAEIAPDRLEHLVACVSDLLTRLTRTAIRRTDAEMCLLRMCRTAEPAAAQTALAPKRMPERRQTPAPENPPEKAAKEEPTAEPEPVPVAEAAEPVGKGRKEELLAAVADKTGPAVRTYLGLADIYEEAGDLRVDMPEEGMIFAEKPAVMQTLREAAEQMGLRGVKISKREQKKPAAESGAAGILKNAREMGIKIK